MRGQQWFRRCCWRDVVAGWGSSLISKRGRQESTTIRRTLKPSDAGELHMVSFHLQPLIKVGASLESLL